MLIKLKEEGNTYCERCNKGESGDRGNYGKEEVKVERELIRGKVRMEEYSKVV
jgi:hypothetical protein